MPARGRGKKAQHAGRVSLRALSKRLGVSATAVQKGIASGRLRKSIAYDVSGRPYIAHPALAAVEWKTGATRPPNSGKANRGPGDAGPGSVLPFSRPAEQPPTKPVGGQLGLPTLMDAQVRVATERARALGLANRIKQGELLDAAVVAREQFETARVVRDAILNVPDRVAAELAGDSDVRRVHARLLAELQRTLVGLAEMLERG